MLFEGPSYRLSAITIVITLQAVELPVSPLPPTAAAELFFRRAKRHRGGGVEGVDLQSKSQQENTPNMGTNKKGLSLHIWVRIREACFGT